MINIEYTSTTISLMKNIFIALATQITFLKIINDKKYLHFNKIIGYIFVFMMIPIIDIINNKTNFWCGMVVLIFSLSCILSKTTKNSIGHSLLITTIALACNYAVYFVAVVIAFFINVKCISIQNDFINLILIICIHVIMLINIFKINKLKYGISFLQRNLNNKYMEMIIINLSVVVLFLGLVLGNRMKYTVKNTFWIFAIFSIMMFITIQKSLQLYYKQKLLAQELEKTKEELANRTKEVEELEAENISISKKAHTLSHKQKSLEYKIEEMMMNVEISKEDVGELNDRLKAIGKDLYKEKTTTELDKTDIKQIDDMLKYMQSECEKNKIDFELQIKGNIHYMINNLISKEDLETLIADHIKNAIIAINHTDNINKSILVRLGEIDGNYGLYIYDSGIEFEKETLENLGKKPSTTHAEEGGTGMGFMNTFDTLRKCKASLTIEEFNEPSKDNYTKAIIIKFDNQNEFNIKSYRQQTVK